MHTLHNLWREDCYLIYPIILKMKYLFSLAFLFCTAVITAQSDITPQVSAALKKGDAATISSLMMPSVELSIEGQENNYSKQDAQKVIAGFFRDHPATGFSVKHQGTSKLDDQYRIGDLTTSKGNFRVTFFMKKSGNALLIRQLKIEAAE
jgi:hypothetical protein